MRIIESSENLTAREVYALTKDPQTRKMSEAAGTKLPVVRWCIYADVDKKTGEERELLAVDTGEGVFATNSATCVESFRSGRELFVQFGTDVHEINVFTGTSKAGRTYLDCSVSD